MANNSLVSYHAFLFPFSIPVPDNISDFYTWFEGNLQNWEQHQTSINESTHSYNQHVYFHDFAEDALFNRPKSNAAQTTASSDIVRQYKFSKLGCYPRFDIYTNGSVLPKYTLRLDSLNLSVYETQVGILTFHLYFEKPQQAVDDWTVTDTDINCINDRGRRLFPQFLEGVVGQYTDLPKRDLLAHKIIIWNDQHVLSTECFDDYGRLIPEKIRLANHVNQLLWGNTANPPAIRPVIDDRMFVVCWWGNNSFSATMKQAARIEEGHLKNPAWYKFVFVDGNGLTCQHDRMLHDLLKASTYDRWANYGMFSGISRYSFVTLTDEGDFAKNKLLADIRYLYLPMVQLCLVQRASVLHFSARIFEASAVSDGQHVQAITQLYQDYIRFVNRLFFREITAQEQGIELYDQMQKIMRIREEVKDLDGEMNELNQFAELQLQRRRTEEQEALAKSQAKLAEEQTKLSRVATIFLPASLLAAMLAWVSDKEWWLIDTWSWNEFFKSVNWLIVILIVLFVAAIGFSFFKAESFTSFLLKKIDTKKQNP